VEPVRSALIAGIAFCGLAVVILSFLPWVTFETRTNSQLPGSPEVSADFSGLDISRSRDIENITEAEAPHAEGWCSCEVAAGDGYFTAALGLVLIASAGIARIGGSGTVQPALYALIAAGAIAAIDGSALWAISRTAEPTDEEAYDYDEDEEPMEGTEAWA